jgi:hypothetical protein
VLREQPNVRRVLEAVRPGVGDQFLMQPMPIRFHPNQLEVAGVHEAELLPAAARWRQRGVASAPPPRPPALPPTGGGAGLNDNDRTTRRSSRNRRALTTFNFTTGGVTMSPPVPTASPERL